MNLTAATAENTIINRSFGIQVLVLCTALWVASTRVSAEVSPTVRSTPDAKSAVEAIAIERAKQWVAAFNTQDVKKYENFLKNNGPAIIKYARDDARYSLLLDGVSIKGDATAIGNHAKVVLAAPFIDGLIILDIKVEEHPPHSILTADLSRPSEEAAVITPFANEQALINLVTQRAQQQAGRNRFSGIVHVENRSGVVLSLAVGNAQELSVGCNASDVALNGASVPKMLVSTSVLRLVASGKVRLDDRIDRHIPELAGRPLGEATVRQLLDHSGGAGDFPKLTGANRLAHQNLFVAGMSATPTHRPGKQWQYANYGYILLGELIRLKTGRDGAAAVEAWLKDLAPPCGTYIAGLTREEVFDPWFPVEKDSFYATPTSAGGQKVTARQISSFFAQLAAEQVVPKPLLLEAWQGKWQMPDGRYGLGFREYERAGLRYVGHGGAAPGANNQISYFPNSGWLIVVLGNIDQPYGAWMSDYIVNRMGSLASEDAMAPKGIRVIESAETP